MNYRQHNYSLQRQELVRRIKETEQLHFETSIDSKLYPQYGYGNSLDDLSSKLEILYDLLDELEKNNPPVTITDSTGYFINTSGSCVCHTLLATDSNGTTWGGFK